MEEQTKLLPYKFSIFYKAIIHFYENEDNIPHDVRFYSKQCFTAYLHESTYKNIRDTTDIIYTLANVALYDEPCDLISSDEYIEDDQSDDFVCFVDNVETNAFTYLEDNEVTYNYDGSSSPQFAHWK